MEVDFRWLFAPSGDELVPSRRVLQVRYGKIHTVGNSRYDRDSDRPNTGKYTQKVTWGKWKNVREEELK